LAFIGLLTDIVKGSSSNPT